MHCDSRFFDVYMLVGWDGVGADGSIREALQ